MFVLFFLPTLSSVVTSELESSEFTSKRTPDPDRNFICDVTTGNFLFEGFQLDSLTTKPGHYPSFFFSREFQYKLRIESLGHLYRFLTYSGIYCLLLPELYLLFPELFYTQNSSSIPRNLLERNLIGPLRFT